jgi:hypothetical protein
MFSKLGNKNYQNGVLPYEGTEAMTTTNQFDEHADLTNLPEAAASYYHAAINDELNGFALTAAVEWQKAAELVAPFPFIANICWQQWERITQLPRRLATPIPPPAQESSHHARFAAPSFSDADATAA